MIQGLRLWVTFCMCAEMKSFCCVAVVSNSWGFLFVLPQNVNVVVQDVLSVAKLFPERVVTTTLTVFSMDFCLIAIAPHTCTRPHNTNSLHFVLGRANLTLEKFSLETHILVDSSQTFGDHPALRWVEGVQSFRHCRTHPVWL